MNINMYKTKLIAFAMFFCSILVANAQAPAGSPVDKYKQLKIFNGKVSDSNGNPVVLRGMSLFWSGYPEGSGFYNETTVKNLRDNWCVDVVRAAMSVETGNDNYIGNPNGEKAKIYAVIDACIKYGLYVVVDFHTHKAENYQSQAIAFFTEVANKYKNYPNVLYEPYNEPIAQSWSGTIKPYHNAVISAIRAIDDNIIICGTGNYSQDVDIAANDQVTGTNIAYTLHYYSYTHRDWLRQKATQALSKGVALFVTEYGTCHASGNGNFDAAESQVWWNYLETNKLSSCNWSIGNKSETSAALTPGTQSASSWASNQLTQSGALVKAYLVGKCNSNPVTGSVSLSFSGGKTQYNQGESVTITAATTVINGTIAKVVFYDGTTALGTSTTSPYSYTTTTLSAGGHTITAKSFDAAGNEIGASPAYVISIVGNSNVATTGITDQFEAKTQFSEMTGGINASSCASVSVASPAAAAGVYWFEERVASTPFKAEATRAGDGTLSYLLSQAANSYNVIGFNFGEYCEGGVKKKYTLDLSKNAVLSVTVQSPATNTNSFDLKFQMKDADGTVLAINKKFLNETLTSNWYKYEIGFSKNHVTPDFVALAPGDSKLFTFDFSQALSIKNPNSPTFPADINTNNTDFDFTKVAEVVIIPVNSADVGAPTYAPKAFTDQTIIFKGLKLGDPTLGKDICTTPIAPTGSDKTYCQNATPAALTATGNAGLVLKWYTSETGGIASEDAPIPSTASAGVYKFYVSQASPSTDVCEGPRKAITVTVNEATASNAGADKTVALGTTTSLTGTGTAVGTWSLVTGPTGATVTFSPSAASATVTTSMLTTVGEYTFRYTVAGSGSCTAATSEVVVTVENTCTTPGAVTAQNVSYCQGAQAVALTASAAASGNKLQWYTDATGGTASDVAPVPSTATVGVKPYYVSQVSTTNPGCESARTPINVTIVAPSTANAGSAQTAVEGPTVDLSATGSATGTWSLLNGPSGVNVSYSPSANSASVTASGLTIKGDYTFRYTVAGNTPCTAVTSDVNVKVVAITSISKALNGMVEIYPNPATDNLVIDMTKVDGNKSVKLVDMLGRVVFEAANENTLNVGMSNLNKGMYFVHIQSESGNLIKSVVKQ